ncbi:MAG TPA: glycogen/starch synthase [Candidatus Limnocylindrales bacterium]|nr:glycogen/starch synthase [Candidatus Limnocylindrales bacterium]
MAMRVAMLSAECEPWAKTGGLGDVVDALARALGELGGDDVETPVDVFLPRYRGVPTPPRIDRTLELRVPDPQAPSGSSVIRVHDVPADGYRLRLVDHPAAFDRDGFYGDADGDYPDNPWRFGLFCRAALEALRADGRPVDLLHLHDWHTGPAAIYRDVRYADDAAIGGAAMLVTLHNLAYHGWTPRAALGQLGLAPGDGVVGPRADGLDLLLTGIERAELVNTVSPTFASEALTPEFGMGLDGALRAKGDRFFGILNGLDTGVWDPATDADLAAPYARQDRTGKALCRSDLLTRIGFDPDDDGAVVGMIGRLDPQKGFDLLAGAAPTLLRRGARLVVQGSGHPTLADPFRAIAVEHPRQVAFIERFDRVMARRIYAGADFFAMPSRFEPCGQGQMIALRYGTPPIVHRTGGLADTVIDETTNPGAGTGFSFSGATTTGLIAACEAAMALRERGGAAWDGLLDRGMAVDFDWVSGAAPRYVEAYRRAIAIRRDGQPPRPADG